MPVTIPGVSMAKAVHRVQFDDDDPNCDIVVTVEGGVVQDVTFPAFLNGVPIVVRVDDLDCLANDSEAEFVSTWYSPSPEDEES